MTNKHSFHIPVMGIGFTIESPLKVASFGINSVISLVDDILLEKLRKIHSLNSNLDYEEIGAHEHDSRARRITSYLNMINKLVEIKFEELKNATNEKTQEIKDYFNMLPDSSTIKQEFKELTSKCLNFSEIKSWLQENLTRGSIDVNIMTKIDKENYEKGVQLSSEYNDAHAALRGYANSDLTSTLVLSAGMNPKLYSYIEQFEDFFPNENGFIKKKIALKVSDYRSALIQGKFLAKKGIWVSEYRIESGLNCGGHAFATEGYLMGPILAEFKEHREELVDEVYSILEKALESKDKTIPNKKLQILLTAQGGVGTAEEHEFLINHYNVDSVGWGSPFLLVPEATTLDQETLQKLIEAKEEDLYLSNISPLGVLFNNLRGNTKDIEKLSLIAKGNPGSVCPKKYLVSNTEFSDKKICTASRIFQSKKLKEIEDIEMTLEERERAVEKVLEKSCICVGLGTTALLVNKGDVNIEGPGVSVCPGPNIAYYSKQVSLKQMIDHIYGRGNVIERKDRPNMFIKELELYIDFLKNKVEEIHFNNSKNQIKHLTDFADNLKKGVDYYQNLFEEVGEKFQETKHRIISDLENNLKSLEVLIGKISNFKSLLA